MQPNNESFTDAQIDLFELFQIIYNAKFILIIAALAGFIIGWIYSAFQPKLYYSEVLLAQASVGSSGGGSFSSQFGGFAQMVGVNLSGGGSSKSNTNLAIEVIKSRKFANDFVKNRNLIPYFFAVEGYDKKTERLFFDGSLYDEKKNKWLEEEPSLSLIQAAFLDSITIDKDTKPGYFLIGFQHQSPKIARDLTNWVVADINAHLIKRDVVEAEKAVDYLQNKASETSIAEIRKIFFELIKRQKETIMLANIRKEYVFETIDPPVIPLGVSSPNVKLIRIIFSVIFTFTSIIMVLLNAYYFKFKLSSKALKTKILER